MALAYRDRKKSDLRNVGLKYECMEHYSGGPPRCVQCGCHDLHLLQLDHINDDGKEQRRQMMAQGYGYQMCAGNAFYQYLRSHGYPDDKGLQVLCKDCHYKKGKPKRHYHAPRLFSLEWDVNNPIPLDVLPQSLWGTDEETA